MSKKNETFRIEAEERIKFFSRRVTELPENVQIKIANDYDRFGEAIDRAYAKGREKSFHRLMNRLQKMLNEAQERCKPSWMYQVTGGIFLTQVWFVSSEDKAKGLVNLGVPRGEIYTAQELAIVLNLSPPDLETLKTIRAAKVIFDGVLIPDIDFIKKEKNPVGQLSDFADKNNKWLTLQDGQKLTVKFLGYKMETDRSGDFIPSYQFETKPGIVKTLQSRSKNLAVFFDEDSGDAKVGAVISLARTGAGTETRYTATLVKQGEEDELFSA